MRSGPERQPHLERLVHSLKELLAVGRERLAAGPEEELRDQACLAQQHRSHMVSLVSRLPTPTKH